MIPRCEYKNNDPWLQSSLILLILFYVSLLHPYPSGNQVTVKVLGSASDPKGSGEAIDHILQAEIGRQFDSLFEGMASKSITTSNKSMVKLLTVARAAKQTLSHG